MERARQTGEQAGQPSLPVRQAFVVQFRAEADIERGKFVGRVEHVVSGQMALFQSVEDLLEFFAQVLTAKPKAKESPDR